MSLRDHALQYEQYVNNLVNRSNLDVDTKDILKYGDGGFEIERQMKQLEKLNDINAAQTKSIENLERLNQRASEQIEHQKSEIERLDNLNRHAAEQLELLKSNFEEEKKERIKTSKQAFKAIVIAAISLLVNAINAAPIIKNFIISLIP